MRDPVKLMALINQIEDIIGKANELAKKYSGPIEKVHPDYRKNALNLVHYLAFRGYKVDELQDRLRRLSLPDLAHIEGHVMKSLLAIRSIINHLAGIQLTENHYGILSVRKSEKLINKNTRQIFGYKSKKRRTRIMVTLPSSAADDYNLVNRLVKNGMNSVRINCAHDDPVTWEKMIANVRRANKALKKKCKIMMDLAGPKLRTGPMIPGPEVIHIRPERDLLGSVIKPSRLWIAPSDIPPPDKTSDAVIPVSNAFVRKIKKGSTIWFTDSRDKKCKITIERKEGEGKWGSCNDSAYIRTGTAIVIEKENKTGEEKSHVGKLLPAEQHITLFAGEKLVMTRDPLPGEPAIRNEKGKIIQHAHISCTLPEIFDFVRKNDPVFFDDGQIEGVVEEIQKDSMLISILHAGDSGSKLKADKGINLPQSDLKVNCLTEKDRKDLEFVALHADAINVSFVRNQDDVQQLLDEMRKYDRSPGIILKIETQEGFRNLPLILLKAMQSYPIGVMIARGDLAVETGWKNFASIQEEILRICEAANIPDIWATQVLENMAKKGIPTRSEITDAALAQRAECVMLNKGPYIEKTVRMLDKILKRMQFFQKKKELLLPQLADADNLELSHDAFNV